MINSNLGSAYYNSLQQIQQEYNQSQAIVNKLSSVDKQPEIDTEDSSRDNKQNLSEAAYATSSTKTEQTSKEFQERDKVREVTTTTITVEKEKPHPNKLDIFV